VKTDLYLLGFAVHKQSKNKQVEPTGFWNGVVSFFGGGSGGGGGDDASHGDSRDEARAATEDEPTPSVVPVSAAMAERNQLYSALTTSTLGIKQQAVAMSDRLNDDGKKLDGIIANNAVLNTKIKDLERKTKNYNN